MSSSRHRLLCIKEQPVQPVRAYREDSAGPRLGGIMSARNGQRARFHRNRKRRIVQRIRLRAVLLALREQKAASASSAARRGQGGPALAADN